MDLPSSSYLLLIPLVWCGLSWLLSRISGWYRLAQRYRAGESIEGESAALRTGRIGPINYHSCLRFQVNEEGMRISIAAPFRLGHPPLFIPWNELHQIREDDMMYSHKVKASIGKPTIGRITLPGWVRYRMPMSIRPVAANLLDEED